MIKILCGKQNTKIDLLPRTAVSRAHIVKLYILQERYILTYTTGHKIKVMNKENALAIPNLFLPSCSS